MEKKEKSVAKNYIYNLIYQIFLLIVPIFVTPYVARALGETATGQYSFSYSIITYFTLFAALGFSNYGQREIARCQNDKKRQSIKFWEMFIARLIPCFITLIVYAVLNIIGVFATKYSLLMLILTIEIIAVAFDITFLLRGNEEFGKIVIRNVIVKIITISLIFIFVKSSDDLWKYTLIQSLSVLISNLLIWVYVPKCTEKVDIKDLNPLKHLKSAFILFIPTIATSIYTSLDKTLIGVITGLDSENGNYEYAEKLVKMALTVVTSLGTVMISRNSQRLAIGDKTAVEKNINNSIKFVFFLGIPLMFGCIAIADNLIPWYLGSGYTKAANLMKILSPIILIIGLSNVFGIQYLIPSGNDKRYTLSIVCGAVTNFILNIILIYYFMSYGAAIATVIAESVVTITMYVYIKKQININSFFENWKYIVAGIIMSIPCYIIGNILPSSILMTILIVVIGATIYLSILLILKDKFLYLLLNKVFNKIKLNKKAIISNFYC